ncbi:MAG: lysine 5,6-aminomutase subunit alpha, partial [Lentimicrobiaceae bacterium]
MQKSKLGLNFHKVAKARQIAGNIAGDVQKFADQYTTVAVERTLCRLMGIDGIDANEAPLPNILVDELKNQGVLSQGVLYYLGNQIAETGLSPQEIANRVSERTLDITKVKVHSR